MRTPEAWVNLAICTARTNYTPFLGRDAVGRWIADGGSDGLSRHSHGEVAHFFLAEKADGGEFTGKDKEVLVLFASEAAAAISNAHAQQRAARPDRPRGPGGDLARGVVVFDAASGRPASFNREARQMAESLRMPGRPPEQLLEVMSFRRADGREVSLNASSPSRSSPAPARRCAPTRWCFRRVVSYDTLLARVWDGRNGAEANLVRISVKNLRRKLGDDAVRPVYILNERGVGYRMPDSGDE